MKFLDNIDLKNKKIVFRADLNIPVLNGKVTDYSRIKSIVPSINQLLKNNNKVFEVAIISTTSDKNTKISYIYPFTIQLTETGEG